MWTTTGLPFLTAVCFFASATLGRANNSKKSKVNLIGTGLVWIAKPRMVDDLGRRTASPGMLSAKIIGAQHEHVKPALSSPKELSRDIIGQSSAAAKIRSLEIPATRFLLTRTRIEFGTPGSRIVPLGAIGKFSSTRRAVAALLRRPTAQAALPR